MRLALITGLTLALAGGLYVGLGPQAFSFYGIAAAGLFASLTLSWTLRQRYTAQGISRWPRLLLTIPAVFAAVVQIGFWLSFFNLGSVGIMMGAMRGSVMHEAGIILDAALALLLLVAAALIWRGFKHSKAQ